jgi:hypothetical protein
MTIGFVSDPFTRALKLDATADERGPPCLDRIAESVNAMAGCHRAP